MRFRSLKVHDTPRPSYLTMDEMDLFFLSARQEPFWHSYFYIQYFYGLRLSDPSSLRKDDVDFEHKEITICRGTTMISTVYPLVDEIKREIVRVSTYLVDLGSTDGTYVFPSAKQTTEKDRSISRFTANSFFDEIWTRAHLPRSLAFTDVLRVSRLKHLEARGTSSKKIEFLLNGA